jgi:hypothetical protein
VGTSRRDRSTRRKPDLVTLLPPQIPINWATIDPGWPRW